MTSRNLISLERNPFQRDEPGARTLCTFTLAVALGLLLQGCATPPRGEAVPTGLETKAMVVGFPDHIRYFPRDPEDIKQIEKEFVDSWLREKAVSPHPGPDKLLTACVLSRDFRRRRRWCLRRRIPERMVTNRDAAGIQTGDRC